MTERQRENETKRDILFYQYKHDTGAPVILFLITVPTYIMSNILSYVYQP